MSVQDAVDQYFVAQGYGEFPVCEEGQVLGVVTVRDVQALPTALWPWRRVREMMRPTSPALLYPTRLVHHAGDGPHGPRRASIVSW